MEQTVTWSEDTWTETHESFWYGADSSQAESYWKARDDAVIHYTGIILSTCWTPLRGIVAVISCSDGKLREVPVKQLTIPKGTEDE